MTRTEAWQLHGSAADLYERYLVPTLFTPWAHDLLDAAALQPGERVLDVACGTGSVTRLIGPQIGPRGHLTALDLNADMLSAAQTYITTATPSIRWLQADVLEMPVDNADFDVVLCQQSFQFFPDKLRALREMHRVLAPGGRLAFNISRGLAHNPYIRALADGLEHHIGVEAGDSMRAPCGFGNAEMLRALLVQAGFDATHIRIAFLIIRHPQPAEFIRGQLAATPVADQVAALSEARQEALVGEVLANLRGYIDDDGLAAPYETHVVMAHV
ncbi:MAG: methyltransferase domain-containing protein [Caldilineaceae bacterium]|nr:methyltransferase domain-containing protein [Caldilineaceae bacterium]MCB0096993.1 methyltransferase domain-containing protein [Caldilineaceae bacterium]MCB0140462.1 methyltransferase domain-containing protein [Caldilineaceae bacterium]